MIKPFFMSEWKSYKEERPKKSGFYMIKMENGNIHYCKYIYPFNFSSGHGKDYRNGGRYPVKKPDKYKFIFGLNKKWEPDERIKYEDWPKGI